MANRVDFQSTNSDFIQKQERLEPSTVKKLIIDVNELLNTLKNNYTNIKDKYQIAKLTLDLIPTITAIKYAVIKTSDVGSSIFNVSPVIVSKKLDEILLILNNSPAVILNAHKKYVDDLCSKPNTDPDFLIEKLDRGDKLLKRPMEFPKGLDQMGADLKAYLKKEDGELTESEVLRFNQMTEYKNITYNSLKTAITNYADKVNNKKLHEITPLEFENLQEVISEIQGNFRAVSFGQPSFGQYGSLLNETCTFQKSLFAANNKYKEEFNFIPNLNFLKDSNSKHKVINKTSLVTGQNGFLIVDKGRSIELEGEKIKINGIPAFQHGGKVLEAASKFIKMLRLVSQLDDPEPRQLLGLSAARHEFLIASKLEDKKLTEEKKDKLMSQWQAALLASALIETMLSPEGYQHLNKVNTYPDYLLILLINYAKTGIKKLIPENLQTIIKSNLFDKTFNKAVIQVEKEFYEQLSLKAASILDFFESVKNKI